MICRDAPAKEGHPLAQSCHLSFANSVHLGLAHRCVSPVGPTHTSELGDAHLPLESLWFLSPETTVGEGLLHVELCSLCVDGQRRFPTALETLFKRHGMF